MTPATATLNHIAVGDTIWLRRFAQHPDAGATREALRDLAQPTSLRQTLADDPPALRRYRDALDAVIVQCARTLTDAQLAAPLTCRNTAGEAHAKPFSASAPSMGIG